MTRQLTLDFRKVRVVRNHWSEIYHLEYSDHSTFAHGEQPQHFETIQEAIAFARERGVDADTSSLPAMSNDVGHAGRLDPVAPVV